MALEREMRGARRPNEKAEVLGRRVGGSQVSPPVPVVPNAAGSP